MTTVDEADAWIGRIAIDSTGRRIGRITRVWIDDYSGLPAWATVAAGRPRNRERIAPLSHAAAAGGRRQLDCRKAEVTSAPEVDADGHFGLEDEWRLIQHYNIASTPDPTRQHTECALSERTGLMTTSTSTPLALPLSGSGTLGRKSSLQDQHRRVWGASGRLSLPSLRRRLGLS